MSINWAFKCYLFFVESEQDTLIEASYTARHSGGTDGGRNLVPKLRLPGRLRDPDQSYQHQVLEGHVVGAQYGLPKWVWKRSAENKGCSHLDAPNVTLYKFGYFERQLLLRNGLGRVLVFRSTDLISVLVKMTLSWLFGGPTFNVSNLSPEN